MKTVVIFLLAAAAALAGSKAPVSGDALAQASQRLDSQLGRMLPADDAIQQVGLTQGTYVGGFGAVFIGSLNLAPMAGISPFHQTISKEELARIHQKKLDRLPKLREAMQKQLLNLAASLDMIPAGDQVALSVVLFNFAVEDVSGLPSQIVMHAPKKLLVDVLRGAADRNGIHAEEF